MEEFAEPSLDLVDVTTTPLAALRTAPSPRQAEQSRRMIDELVVAMPANQVQTESPFVTDG